MRPSLKTITILTELPLKVIFHTVHVNHKYICRCVGAVRASTQNRTVLYNTLQSQVPSARVLGRCKLPGVPLCYIHTYITKRNIILQCVGVESA